jgi:hypothetical protein
LPPAEQAVVSAPRARNAPLRKEIGHGNPCALQRSRKTNDGAFAAHRFWQADAAQYMNQYNHVMKNMAIIGGLLAFAHCGAGRLSLDSR